ncbi:MAG: hypothetical protein ACLSDJ_05560 [Butyricimonas faecihominis]
MAYSRKVSRVIRFHVIQYKFIAELEFSRAVNQVDIPAYRLTVGTFHDSVLP